MVPKVVSIPYTCNDEHFIIKKKYTVVRYELVLYTVPCFLGVEVRNSFCCIHVKPKRNGII